ncbi:mono-functional DNA-alkylating methyl methanesulfonate N-term-domain-containing protein [Umbelopsis sp. PMI_123]|nr:mono-functional DNA-alkylating methyl methanesulfonate N-term-domain-containing protein [Umbelopsis sp. PMI_123]
MTIERCGRLPLDRVGPLPLLLIPICDVPETFILITELYASYLTVDDVYSGNVLHPTSNLPTNADGEVVIFTAYTAPKSPTPSILYLGTSSGDFYALDINTLAWHFIGQRNSVGVAMQYLGPAYHENGHKDVIVYAGEGADHEVITIDFGQNLPGISLLQTLENRAPLIDAHISHDPQSSLDVLYTCTGQDRYGCLREIRSGVGVEMLSISPADPQWDGVTGIWYLPYDQENKDCFYIIVSFALETRVLSNVDQEMQDVSETCGLICDKATIFAGFCDSGPRVLVQVLESSVNLYNTAKGSITEVQLGSMHSSNHLKVAHVAMEDAMLILCSTSLDNQSCLHKFFINAESLENSGVITLEQEISFMNIISTSQDQKYLIVGTHRPSICIYSTEDLVCVHEALLVNVSTAGINIPESCVFLEHQSCCFLVVGLRDGTLISYQLDLKIDGSIQLGNGYQRPLGSLPVKLISQNKHSCVAVSEYMWYVEQRNKRIVIKPICLLESDYVAAITSLPSDDGYQSYAAVIDQKLCMICLDPRQDINIRTTHIGETSRRILHDKPTNCLIVAYSGVTNSGRQDGLNVVHDGKIVANVKMAEHEIICSMAGWSIQHQTKTYRYICVGVALHSGTRHDHHVRRTPVESGRLLLYRLKRRKKDMQYCLSQVWHEDSLPAGVFAICPHPHGLLFSTGRILHLHQLDISTGRLEMVAQESARSPITLIQVSQERICIGTQLDSLSFYRYDSDSRKLLFLKSDMLMRTVSGAVMPHAGLVIGTERYGGIFGLIEDINKPTSRSLSQAFGFHMPDVALGVQTGTLSLMDRLPNDHTLSWDDASSVRKPIFACTLSGGIVVVRRITQETYDFLRIIESRIRQRNCARLLSTIYWPTEITNTLNGDILYLFLRMTASEQQSLLHDEDMNILDLKVFPANVSAIDKVTNIITNLQYL